MVSLAVTVYCICNNVLTLDKWVNHASNFNSGDNTYNLENLTSIDNKVSKNL
mgnify:CR=1 FL=1